MKLANAAIGLAAMGAGLLMARAMSTRRGGKLWQSAAPSEPPSPGQLIGNQEAHLSASDAAEAFRTSRDRPV